MDTESASEKPRHTIRIAARRTGLTAATLRAWERRHGAVRPARSDTERRLYSDADIERLRLMRELVAEGHGIAQLARLSTGALSALAGEEREAAGAGGRHPAAPSSPAAGAAPPIDACERAILALDAAELYRLLMRATVELGPVRFVDDLVTPLLRRIGQACERGSLSVAHEHVASVSIRQALGFLLETLRVRSAAAPALVAATPQGERHEFGAMMAASVAAMAGWRVAYVGPDLPASDIAIAVRQAGARVLALSIVSLRGGGALAAELKTLREGVGRDVVIVVGGTAAALNADALDDIDAVRLEELAELRTLLADREGATQGTA